MLPYSMPWPEGENGPLHFLMSINCAAIPTEALDIPFPRAGRLLFFSSDTSSENRVIHVPKGVSCVERQAPGGLGTRTAIPLFATCVLSAPPLSDRHQQRLADVARTDAFEALVGQLTVSNSGYQIGGYPPMLRNAPDMEVVSGHLCTEEDDARVAQQLRTWALLATYDMAHIREGPLMSWLIRRSDIAAYRFDRAVLAFARGS
ncbi:DUF1963 domain-containing protein [Streptomyces sp. CA-250714]|uniref:DUF1963 domain-containing protein n=1 Tax=Streptomyces sp. CA-250714 TaxID=3240060 RepID=UPI003D90715C